MKLHRVAGTIRRPEIARGWRHASDGARAILCALAELGTEPVPSRLLARMHPFEVQPDAGEFLKSTLDELSLLGLVGRDPEGDPWIDDAVRAYVRRLTAGTDRPLPMVSGAVRREMKRWQDGCDTEGNGQLRKLVPHAIALIKGGELAPTEAVELSHAVAQHQWRNGHYTSAVTFLRRAVDQSLEAFEPGHPSIAISEANLALALEKLGHLKEAAEILRRVLDSAKRNFPPGHPTIATSKFNLALVLQDLGRLEEARDLLRQVVALDANNYRPDHPSGCDSIRHLALVLRDLGETTEARDLLEKAHLSMRERFGSAHPKTQLITVALQSLHDR